PEEQGLAHAEELLTDLGALKVGQTFESAGSGDFPVAGRDSGPGGPEHRQAGKPALHITPIGRKMLAFPVHPRYARMLLAAQEYRCVRAVALIAALTQGRNLMRRVENKQAREDREDVLGSDAESDLFILMRAFRYAENSR